MRIPASQNGCVAVGYFLAHLRLTSPYARCGGKNLRVTQAIFSPTSIARYINGHMGHDPPDTGSLNLLPLEPSYDLYID